MIYDLLINNKYYSNRFSRKLIIERMVKTNGQLSDGPPAPNEFSRRHETIINRLSHSELMNMHLRHTVTLCQRRSPLPLMHHLRRTTVNQRSIGTNHGVPLSPIGKGKNPLFHSPSRNSQPRTIFFYISNYSNF